MITLLFTILVIVSVLAIKEMARMPEKSFPEAATDGASEFFSDLKLVISAVKAKSEHKKTSTPKENDEETPKEVDKKALKEAESDKDTSEE